MKKLMVTVMFLCYFATLAGFIWMLDHETVRSTIGIATTVTGITATFLLSWLVLVLGLPFGDDNEKPS